MAKRGKIGKDFVIVNSNDEYNTKTNTPGLPISPSFRIGVQSLRLRNTPYTAALGNVVVSGSVGLTLDEVTITYTFSESFEISEGW